jgi:hypothetical protein
MDTDPDQHSPMNMDQGLATVMDTDQGRVAMDTAHRPATTMVTDQGRVTAMDTDQDLATVMDTDQGRVTAMDTDQDLATVMDTDQGRVTAMDTDQDPATTMDTDQCRVAMDTDQRPVTDAPLGRQPMRQTVMGLSCRSDRTCPRPLLVNDDQRARALALFIAFGPFVIIFDGAKVVSVPGGVTGLVRQLSF